MNWTQIPLGPLQTNAYILQNESKDAIVIDPGGDGQALLNWLKSEKLKPLAILLTHAHFDHIGAVDDVRTEYNCPVYIHKQEQDWLQDPAKNGSSRFLGTNGIRINEADQIINEEKTIKIGTFEFTVFETPGHSPGSVSYYVESEQIVFSGDALFAQSIGRTDLPGGNHQQLLDSIHKKLLELPEETIVACGHGPTTTIGSEMDSNPFLTGF
ncbi:hydroxyacylglutathione hydrolase [Halalkalibacter wakoensis JCM 9140]|uniref:Hydroxyacylglutathione hydrolase n=1 Tax=Halalkalibacter wakoensis JCM 9140 TaxID=1236970 RepID=W4Q8S4_9BACI|nr:MBL fold metallo-hydrolase [Halalkalibacter wakoensis]GAE28436.1 hydroxyacylglutathione hydrolase [Halalkalibacter wakoensis JCM 9140]